MRSCETWVKLPHFIISQQPNRDFVQDINFRRNLVLNHAQRVYQSRNFVQSFLQPITSRPAQFIPDESAVGLPVTHAGPINAPGLPL